MVSIKWSQKKITLKELKRRTGETKEPSGERKWMKLGQSSLRRVLNKMFVRNLPLTSVFKEVLSNANRKSQNCLQNALTNVPKQENFKEVGIALRSILKLSKTISSLKKQLNQYPKIVFTTLRAGAEVLENTRLLKTTLLLRSPLSRKTNRSWSRWYLL